MLEQQRTTDVSCKVVSFSAASVAGDVVGVVRKRAKDLSSILFDVVRWKLKISVAGVHSTGMVFYHC